MNGSETAQFADGGAIPDDCRTEIVSSSDFDSGLEIAPENIRRRARALQDAMNSLGFHLLQMRDVSALSTEIEARRAAGKIHTAAAILYGEWELARSTGDKKGELAAARLVNGMTKAARDIHERFEIFDVRHVQRLGEELADEANGETARGEVDVRRIADALNDMGNQRTHENAWPWVVLPTFPKQHYGRILLFTVPGLDERFPIFITQPTFLSGEGTQFHTHGQNWAFARPIGNNRVDTNCHINTLWQPTEPHVFPMSQISKDDYTSSSVVIIPPRAIHAITGTRQTGSWRFTIKQLLEGRVDLETYTAGIQFANHSSIHIYRPDGPLSRELEHSPLVKHDPAFFIENDMIVFDHQLCLIWSGGGGAWARRMVEYGTQGEHCGACFIEDDPRNEQINPQDVLQWYAKPEQSRMIKFSYPR